MEHHVTVGGAKHPGQPSETDRDRPEEVRLKLPEVNLSTGEWEGVGGRRAGTVQVPTL